MQGRFYDIAVCIGAAAAIAVLAAFPSEAVDAAAAGVKLCAGVIVPSLFPYFVLSSLIVELGLAERAGRYLTPVMRPLFGSGGAASAALALGLVGGYPVGARTVAAIYASGAVERDEAERLLAFTNNSGPAFILGVVGAGVFGSGKLGLLLLLSHMLSAVLVGVVFRRKRSKSGSARPPARPAARPPLIGVFVGSVRASCEAMLGVCGFVVFFAVAIRMLSVSGVTPLLSRVIGSLGPGEEWAARLVTGLLELCSGVWSLRSAHAVPAAAAASFMLGWGGLSVHFQTLSVLSGSGLKTKRYFAGKLLQGVISAALTAALLHLFPAAAPAFSAPLAPSVSHVAAATRTAALAVFALTLPPLALASKNTGKKHGKHL